MAVKVAMMSVTMLLLVAVVARVDARFDFSPILNSMLQQTDNSVKKDVDCCEICICAISEPPQCRSVVARVDASFYFSPILNSILQQTDNSVKRMLIVVNFASVPYHILLHADVRIIGHIALHPAKTACAPNQFLLNAFAATSPRPAPLNIAWRKTRVIK
ncbi:hypothetical protein HHK36_007254 [Tetracentron sinense]|uniref:Uncharacterized protein n=1 Tax=Tetracentron sinense TaxID=13715 RepID=A0A834ZT74_TETSI|nr:hypothetical protein HHK36_007254 [Tetracentron sinense]